MAADREGALPSGTRLPANESEKIPLVLLQCKDALGFDLTADQVDA